MHSSILRRIWLHFMGLCVFSHISNFQICRPEPSLRRHFVEMRIWCINIRSYGFYIYKGLFILPHCLPRIYIPLGFNRRSLCKADLCAHYSFRTSLVCWFCCARARIVAIKHDGHVRLLITDKEVRIFLTYLTKRPHLSTKFYVHVSKIHHQSHNVHLCPVYQQHTSHLCPRLHPQELTFVESS
jgi:hypothetical protein